jgi:hypothetical protein
MTKLTFTIQEMITALQKIGYEAKYEDEVEIINYYHSEQEVPRKVWNLYRNGELVTDSLFSRWYGTRRLEWVFEREVQKRILELF